MEMSRWTWLSAVPCALLPLAPVHDIRLVAHGAALGLVVFGALAYAFRRPNPAPATFGYHEIFHLLVIGAAAFHFVAIAAYVLPQA